MIACAIGFMLMAMLLMSPLRADRITRTGVLEPFSYRQFTPDGAAQDWTKAFTMIAGPRVEITGRSRPLSDAPSSASAVTPSASMPATAHTSDESTAQAVACALDRGKAVRIRDKRGRAMVFTPSSARTNGWFGKIYDRARQIVNSFRAVGQRVPEMPAAIGHGNAAWITNYQGKLPESQVAAQVWARDPRAKIVATKPGDIQTGHGYSVQFTRAPEAASRIVNSIPGVAVPLATTKTQPAAGATFAVNQYPRELVAKSVASIDPTVAIRGGDTALQKFWRSYQGTRY